MCLALKYPTYQKVRYWKLIAGRMKEGVHSNSKLKFFCRRRLFTHILTFFSKEVGAIVLKDILSTLILLHRAPDPLKALPCLR